MDFISFPKDSQKSAHALFDLLVFERPESRFKIEFSKLKTWKARYGRDTAHAPRTKELFSAPLVIIPQTPGESRERAKAFISRTTPIAFAQGNYGFSASGSSDGKLLVSLLYLITHSTLYQHFCLIKSSRIGASYAHFIKGGPRSFPIPQIRSTLRLVQKRRILALAETLETRNPKPRAEIDDFIFAFIWTRRARFDCRSGYGYFLWTISHVSRACRATDQSQRSRSVSRLFGGDATTSFFASQAKECLLRSKRSKPIQWNPPWQLVSITLVDDILPDIPKIADALDGRG